MKPAIWHTDVALRILCVPLWFGMFVIQQMTNNLLALPFGTFPFNPNNTRQGKKISWTGKAHHFANTVILMHLI